jgi:hypothetical protein
MEPSCPVECTMQHYPELLLKSKFVIYLVECKFNIKTGASLQDSEKLNKKFECKIPCDVTMIKIIILPYKIKNVDEIANKLSKKDIYLYICEDKKLSLHRARKTLGAPYKVRDELPCPEIVCQICRQCSLLQ